MTLSTLSILPNYLEIGICFAHALIVDWNHAHRHRDVALCVLCNQQCDDIYCYSLFLHDLEFVENDKLKKSGLPMDILHCSVISVDISCELFTTYVCSVTWANCSRSNSLNLKSSNHVQHWLADQSERRIIDCRALWKIKALNNSAVSHPQLVQKVIHRIYKEMSSHFHEFFHKPLPKCTEI